MCQQTESAHKKSHNCSSIKTPVGNQDEARNSSGYIADSNLQCSQVDDRLLDRRVLSDRSHIKIRECNYVMQV
ncbi:hypothetical protein [Dendronalium sp. ChiSLP03b]|uniref:hypothetical protein n=1 Tax=Dendronalium sp. ChiSLP03b TaxID=3075381 RepID=UPI002AD1D263|nr:hypothetical protein [Dendronalium sp. ChiSLP03b]MDZ8207921.1 hypothetical protein [Dendronalium sp. ChiSLP03b]